MCLGGEVERGRRETGRKEGVTKGWEERAGGRGVRRKKRSEEEKERLEGKEEGN